MTLPSKAQRLLVLLLATTAFLRSTTTAVVGDEEVTLAVIAAVTGVEAEAVPAVNSAVVADVAVESSGEDVAVSAALLGANRHKGSDDFSAKRLARMGKAGRASDF